jgi:DNA-binding transcriptional LysR family regulator
MSSMAEPLDGSGMALLRRLRTRHILLLLALGEQPSLRKAAAALSMPQPAASKLLQELEAAIGATLFDRSRRGLIANAAGDIMIRHARAVTAGLDHAWQEVRSLAEGDTGQVRVGTLVSAAPSLVAQAVSRLKQERPHLLVAIEVDTSDKLLPALGRDELDVIVARPWRPGNAGSFVYEELVDETLAVAARRDHPLLDTERLTLRDLVAWPWALLPPGAPMRHALAPLFHEVGLDAPVNLVETASMLTTVVLLQETDTVSILPEDVMAFFAREGLLARLPVRLPPVMGAYGIITRRGHLLPSGAEAFLACLRAVFHERQGS